MSESDREKWDERYAKREPFSTSQPDAWLLEALELIEQASDGTIAPRIAIDMACGLGQNAIWLARQGWQTDAVDISSKGLEIARQDASANGVNVCWIEGDLDHWTPQTNHYDLAIVFRFLDRDTVPRAVRTALRPGGWLIYETFSAAQCSRSDNHVSNPAFTLGDGELAALFPDFHVVTSREDVLSDRTVQRFLGRRERLS